MWGLISTDVWISSFYNNVRKFPCPTIHLIWALSYDSTFAWNHETLYVYRINSPLDTAVKDMVIRIKTLSLLSFISWWTSSLLRHQLSSITRNQLQVAISIVLVNTVQFFPVTYLTDSWTYARMLWFCCCLANENKGRTLSWPGQTAFSDPPVYWD